MHSTTHQRCLRSWFSKMASRSPVLSHSRAARMGSSIWKRSLTRTASPRLGREGVVCKGRVLRKVTYSRHRDRGKKDEMSAILGVAGWSWMSKSTTGNSGLKAGQDTERAGWLLAGAAASLEGLDAFLGLAISWNDGREATRV